MIPEIKNVLHKKFAVIKELAMNVQGYDVGNIQKVLTETSLL